MQAETTKYTTPKYKTHIMHVSLQMQLAYPVKSSRSQCLQQTVYHNIYKQYINKQYIKTATYCVSINACNMLTELSA